MRRRKHPKIFGITLHAGTSRAHESKGLPPLPKVPQFPGVHGTETDATVLVAFLRVTQPSRSCVCGYERPDATGATVTQIRLAGGTKKNARDNYPIEAGHLRFDDTSSKSRPGRLLLGAGRRGDAGDVHGGAATGGQHRARPAPRSPAASPGEATRCGRDRLSRLFR